MIVANTNNADSAWWLGAELRRGIRWCADVRGGMASQRTNDTNIGIHLKLECACEQRQGLDDLLVASGFHLHAVHHALKWQLHAVACGSVGVSA